jgi:hypothetical protein
MRVKKPPSAVGTQQTGNATYFLLEEGEKAIVSS